MKLIKAIVFAALVSVPNVALAGLVTTEFNDGDSLAAWSVDRGHPGVFEISNNQLEMTILGNEPSDFLGMKMDIEKSNYVSIDMLFDDTWNSGFAGMWAEGHQANDTIGGWPNMSYDGNIGVRTWDNNGWNHLVNPIFNVGEFNNLLMKATGSAIEYYLNGTLVYTDGSGDVDHFSSVILNAYNYGNDYTVVYDNLVYGTVPEPAPLALLGFGLLGLAFARKRKAL